MTTETTEMTPAMRQALAQVEAMRNGRALTGLSVAARADLSAHALNNEGTLNNAQIERQVNVVAGDEVVLVNAVSGDVLKHGFIDHLRTLALGAGAGLPICENCRRGDPNTRSSKKRSKALTRPITRV